MLKYSKLILSVLLVATLSSCDTKLSISSSAPSSSNVCKTEECETSFAEFNLGLPTDLMTDGNKAIVSTATMDQFFITGLENFPGKILGSTVVPAEQPCRDAEPIQDKVFSAHDFLSLPDGSWRICLAVSNESKKRILLYSPMFELDKQAPVIDFTLVVLNNNSSEPMIKWQQATDKYSAADALVYSAYVYETQEKNLEDIKKQGLQPSLFIAEKKQAYSAILKGLTANKNYQAFLKVTDEAGNASYSKGASISTLPPGLPLLEVSKPSVTVAKADTIITWNILLQRTDKVDLTKSLVNIRTTQSAQATLQDVRCDASQCEVSVKAGSGNGTVGIEIAKGFATNGLGSSPLVAEIATVSLDNTPPALEFGVYSSTQASVSSTISVDLQFSDATQINLQTSDVIICATGTASATASILNGNSVRPAVSLSNFTGVGNLTLTINAGVARDGVGNITPSTLIPGTIAVNADVPSYDISAPSITSIDTYRNTSSQIDYVVTYSNALTVALNSSHVSLDSNGNVSGTISVSGSGNTRTVSLSNISGMGLLGIKIAAGSATNSNGNASAKQTPRSAAVNLWNDLTLSGQDPSTCANTPASCVYNQMTRGIQFTKPSASTVAWTQASSSCSTLTYNGKTGWRLPTATELAAAYEDRISFLSSGVDWNRYYWTSTDNPVDSAEATQVNLGTNAQTNKSKIEIAAAICVRPLVPTDELDANAADMEYNADGIHITGIYNQAGSHTKAAIRFYSYNTSTVANNIPTTQNSRALWQNSGIHMQTQSNETIQIEGLSGSSVKTVFAKIRFDGYPNQANTGIGYAGWNASILGAMSDAAATFAFEQNQNFFYRQLSSPAGRSTQLIPLATAFTATYTREPQATILGINGTEESLGTYTGNDIVASRVNRTYMFASTNFTLYRMVAFSEYLNAAQRAVVRSQINSGAAISVKVPIP